MVRTLLLLICLITPLGAADDVDFAHDVAPIFKQRCAECHGGNQKKGGLSLNTRESLLAGGESGNKTIVPGKSGGELLARLTTADKDLRMPPEGDPLTPKQIAAIKRWI